MARSKLKVLRIASITDDLVCDELHQTAPGSVTAGVGVENALLVTQGFHLPRAIFLCNMLGMDTLGVEAIHCYWNGSPFVWDVREQFATVAAFLDLYVSNPLPVLGAPEPMFVD